MSHLHDLLNPDSSRNHSPILAVETEPEPTDSQSSSAEDDISPASDDEIDELDEESAEEEEYDEPSPLPALKPAADQAGEGSIVLPDGPQSDNKEDRVTTRKEEKRPEKASEPAPRRRLEKHDRKIDLGLHDHKAHADCPDTLACLPDTHGRPQHTLPVILRCAILGSPRKRLTIREIYATMESKYPYYKSAGQTWKQSVRHHLSLNRLFERQPRPVTDPGFGSYWTVNLAAPPGTKRPRKRGRPNKDAVEGSSTVAKKGSGSKSGDISPESLVPPGPTKFQFQPQSHPAPPPPPLPLPQVNTLSPLSPLTLQPTPQPQPQPHGNQQSSPQSRQPPPPPPPPQASQVPIAHKPQFAPIQLTMYDPRQHHPPANYPPQLKSPTHLHPHRPHDSQRPQDSQRSHDIQRQQEAQRQHDAQRKHDVQRQHDTQRQHQHDTRRSSISQQTNLHSHRKLSTPVTPLSGRESTYPPSSKDSEAEDGMNTNGPTISDDEFESEEEMIHPYVRRESQIGAFVPTRPSPIFSLPPFSTLEHNREDIVEHMRHEIATLRRTSAEAVSTSLRLTEQLANANLEVSRSREAVRDLEDMLQREATQRKEAERMKDQETERRRAAEHALGSLANRSPVVRTRPT